MENKKMSFDDFKKIDGGMIRDFIIENYMQELFAMSELDEIYTSISEFFEKEHFNVEDGTFNFFDNNFYFDDTWGIQSTNDEPHEFYYNQIDCDGRWDQFLNFIKEDK